MSTPPRPDLTERPSKPDVLVRLRWWLKELPPEYLGLREDIANAIGVIEGLRESDARRLVMIEGLKRELADLRPSEGR